MIPKYFSEVPAALAPAVANHLWQSTLFAALAAILTLAFKKNQARTRHYLWLAASLKFLIPFSLLIGLGRRLASPRFSLGGRSKLSSAVEGFGQPFTFVVIAPVNHATNAASLLAWLPGLIAAVWLCGFVAVVIIWSVRWRRVVAAVHRSTPMEQGPEVDALRQLEKTIGMRRPMAFLLSRERESVLEPGIFGIFRPVLLWPAAISEHLQDSHLNAILAHEISHVRRRDNLASALHMMVEAIFWFHPMIWWLGARLVEERELACDEEVLQLGNPPSIYAESILKTCEFCVGSDLACVSGMTGAELKKRIVRIMTPAPAEKLGASRRLLLASAGVAAVVGPVLFGLWNTPLVRAQSPQASKPQAAVDFANLTLDAPNPRSSQAVSAQQIYHVGRDVSAPTLMIAPNPEYSEEARRAKYQGVCVVSLIVDAQGNPRRVQVVRHLGKGLDKKAVEAVRQYKFAPAIRNGEPVAVEVNIEVNFRLY
jgi:bla regulator protein blaR1